MPPEPELKQAPVRRIICPTCSTPNVRVSINGFILAHVPRGVTSFCPSTGLVYTHPAGSVEEGPSET